MALRHLISVPVKLPKWSTTNKIVLALLALLFVFFLFCLLRKLFNEPYSTVLYDSKGELLGARIAADQQWRFPPSDSVPFKFSQSVVYFEDQYFYRHPGINPVSMVKAAVQNIRAGRVVRGGSTISQQVIRLSDRGAARSIFQKLKESILAIRLEVRYSKDEILQMWSNHAPFGGNVVGLEAASWRYFGRNPYQLSWAETATLAVLPNAPALIHPGRNQQVLKLKRNSLLKKLHDKGVIDTLTYELSLLEELPGEPYPLPQLAPHLLSTLIKQGAGQQTIHSYIDANLQRTFERLLQNHINWLAGNEIHNISLMVSEVETGKVLVYLGNVASGDDHQPWVDIIQSERSSGSTLKPFLYGLMLDEGQILPDMLLVDIPTYYRGFTPKNFDRGFDGAVPASDALARSLNIPAVRLLHQYGIERFYSALQKLGFTTLHQPADHYGLSLILGGAEVRHFELHRTYASMAHQLSSYAQRQDNESATDKFHLHLSQQPVGNATGFNSPIISDGALWQVFKALSVMDRPIEGVYWDRYASSKRIAWKTGTSFGHRDAWAVGLNGRYVVSVWVGNADGEGRPGLTGAASAAPVMFDVFKLLPGNNWFSEPYDEFYPLTVCRESGYSAGTNCPHVDTIGAVHAGLRSSLCPYHQLIHLDENKQYRVSADCYPVSRMQNASWFVLPPLMEWYYKKNHPMYYSLPAFGDGCIPAGNDIEILYPARNTQVFIPRNLYGEKEKVVCEAVSRTSTVLFWHLDNVYLGQTDAIHQMQIDPSPGRHVLVVMTRDGQVIERTFEVIE